MARRWNVLSRLRTRPLERLCRAVIYSVACFFDVVSKPFFYNAIPCVERVSLKAELPNILI
jgi:hypothetical protein